jgi:hypothetical protein
MVGNQLLLMVKSLTKEKRRSAISARDFQKPFREFKNLSKTEITQKVEEINSILANQGKGC